MKRVDTVKYLGEEINIYVTYKSEYVAFEGYYPVIRFYIDDPYNEDDELVYKGRVTLKSHYIKNHFFSRKKYLSLEEAYYKQLSRVKKSIKSVLEVRKSEMLRNVLDKEIENNIPDSLKRVGKDR